jgi:hypothetical protein
LRIEVFPIADLDDLIAEGFDLQCARCLIPRGEPVAIITDPLPH